MLKIVGVGAVGLLLVACSSTGGSGSSGTASSSATSTGPGSVVKVSSTDSECVLSANSAPAGEVTFSVSNDGSDVTEFYLYGQDGETIVSEVEDIAPGVTRDMVADVQSGDYVAACKPGMSGSGVRVTFSVQ